MPYIVTYLSVPVVFWARPAPSAQHSHPVERGLLHTSELHNEAWMSPKGHIPELSGRWHRGAGRWVWILAAASPGPLLPRLRARSPHRRAAGATWRPSRGLQGCRVRPGRWLRPSLYWSHCCCETWGEINVTLIPPRHLRSDGDGRSPTNNSVWSQRAGKEMEPKERLIRQSFLKVCSHCHCQG